ncbi:glycosyltransferase family 32 protein [Pedobacter sp. V48]|uniref:glycosyltransferase family 32 protein n=1 Tax=Pedobacter sp. V48 TaxID=509635 RepID=UPI0003E56672|nr:glycosyltransferase [Pedobacter sp. V48]ETZ23852.1 hypothetical protein N824_15050 [Pedobacter sp. V48]
MRTLEIPKIIHQIVGQKTNSLIERCLNSWNDNQLDGFERKLWTDSDIIEFLLTYHPFAYEAFIKSRNYAEAADIARYLIIYTYGGYYVDWDIELLDPLKFLRLGKTHNRGYMIVDSTNGSIASEYFCSIVNDPFLLNLTHDIVRLFNSGERDQMFSPQYSGPFRMRDSLIAHPETKMASVPLKEVFAYDYNEIRNPSSDPVTQPLIHYWVHSWIRH